MAPTIDQSDRWLTIDSPFGADQLVLTAFDGEEALSELFSYRLALMSPGRLSLLPALAALFIVVGAITIQSSIDLVIGASLPSATT